MAAGVAHEINNPLAAVIANMDYVAESLLQRANILGGGATGDLASFDARAFEEVRGALNEARDAAQRVRIIVRDLKIFSRSPSEDGVGAVDVKAVMDSAIGLAWNEIRHRASLSKDYAVTPPVAANEGRLGQVFLNLLVNAAQALPEGLAEQNVIRVDIRVEADRIVTSVSDTGPGIPADIIGRIFDPFFTTKAVGVGTGLGLAICRRIVTDMGGELTVESQVGKGATFRVALPTAAEEARSMPAAPVEVPQDWRRGRVLVVDDEQMLVSIVTRILSRDHDVVATVIAKDALAMFESGERFDLILCDLMMPDMTGMDLHKRVMSIAPDQAARFIFLTGGAFTEAARTFLADPPKEHIEKPFDLSNLRAIVRRHVQDGRELA
jgi:CheY-like chemotaxis protein